MKIELAPSILSSNFAQLGSDALQAIEGGGTLLHVDVMDGHFVPNITLGPAVVKSLRKAVKVPLDCHLMIENPDQFIPERFLSNGEYITTKPSAFIPFGVGRRVCLGEKLAIADLFIVLVRFIQKTNEYNLTLHSHNGLDPVVSYTQILGTKPFEIILTRK